MWGIVRISGKMIVACTVGQQNYFMTIVTVLYELPLVAVLIITGNNNVIFHILQQHLFCTLRHMVKYGTCKFYFNY